MSGQHAQKILFTRNFKYPTGGHVTVRDFFIHSLRHPRLDAFLYFTPQSKYGADKTWQDIPCERIVNELAPDDYDLLFVGGKDWRFLPGVLGHKKVINAIQGVRHATEPELRSYLGRPAYRICNSPEVYEAVAPFVNGVAVVINNGVDTTLFNHRAEKKTNSILIWGKKNPALAARLFEALKRWHVDVQLLVDSLPRQEFAQLLQAADIFVTLPVPIEGAHRPPLEGMACRCAVVCADAIGNRSYCIDGQTCLQPRHGDFDGHLAAIQRLLHDERLKERIRRHGHEMSQRYGMEEQRRQYYRFLDEYIL
jgi:glycosyltransferase involved in cell wall biosynthesis